MQCPNCGNQCRTTPTYDQHGAFHSWECPECLWQEGDSISEELQTIRLLRWALAAIWTALEEDDDNDKIINDAQVIASEGLELSIKYAKPGKDLADDSRGMESWRVHVSEDGQIIKDF